jgi:hypothetical protein
MLGYQIKPQHHYKINNYLIYGYLNVAIINGFSIEGPVMITLLSTLLNTPENREETVKGQATVT